MLASEAAVGTSLRTQQARMAAGRVVMAQSAPAVLAQTSSQDPGLVAGLSGFDLTALTVLILFGILGVARGLWWQVARLVTLAVAFVASGLYGAEVAARIRGWFSVEMEPEAIARVAHFSVFLLVLLVVGTLAWVLGKLAHRKPETSWGSRLGGGMLGLLTGAGLVLAVLTSLLMFATTDSAVAHAARSSYWMRVGRDAMAALGDSVPLPVQRAYGVAPAGGPPPVPSAEKR